MQKTKENAYVRAFLRQNNSSKKIKECKTLLLYKDLTLKDLIALTDGSYCFFLIICNKNNQRFITLDFNQTQELLCSYRLYDKVEQILIDLFPNKAKELNSG